ncbi:MAG: exodeoxyribonuclease VII large subunit, partial [Jatrophihabitantaceae bacterium]
RLPGVRFAIENTATQGNTAVTEIIDALKRLDANPDVQVIVIARGGGGVEDLLPFSNEALLRAVAAASTPVVSAIGHETDRPLLDLVADLAVSTPTDAAKRIVPDLAVELSNLADIRGRLRASVHRRLDTERELMAGLPQRLRHGVRRLIANGQDEASRSRDRMRDRLDGLLQRAEADTEQLLARVISLSPQAVLNRGYAVLRNQDGALIRQAEQAEPGALLAVRVADGEFSVLVPESVAAAAEQLA